MGLNLFQMCWNRPRKKLESFIKNSDSFDKFEIYEPMFVMRNCLQIVSDSHQYDWIYYGAGVQRDHEEDLVQSWGNTGHAYRGPVNTDYVDWTLGRAKISLLFPLQH